MQSMLLGLASAAVFGAAAPAPASAHSFAASSVTLSSGFRTVRSASATPNATGLHRFDGRHRRHIHLGEGIAAAGFGYAAGYDDQGDYDANRSFDPDRWNDWWHDRPDRAFPRWMSHNQDCQRVWWSGGGWRC